MVENKLRRPIPLAGHAGLAGPVRNGVLAGQAKISYFEVPRLANKEIGWLEVAVNNALHMEVRHTKDYLEGPAAHKLGVQGSCAAEEVLHIDGHVLEHHVCCGALAEHVG